MGVSNIMQGDRYHVGGGRDTKAFEGTVCFSTSCATPPGADGKWGSLPDELHLGYLLQQRMRLSLCGGGGGGGGACVYVLVKKIRLARLAMISA